MKIYRLKQRTLCDNICIGENFDNILSALE